MKLGIIGVGPRGLSALEQLIKYISRLSVDKKIEIVLFEKSTMQGYGHVYDINQVDTNWINITERALKNLNGRASMIINGVEIPAIQKYTESSFAITEDDSDEYPDVFPRRSVVGLYLKQRFDTLVKALEKTGILTFVQQKVVNLNVQTDKIFITTEDETVYSVDEVLITIGHQPTEIDEQLLAWKKATNPDSGPCLFEETYPIRELQDSIKTENHENIAIRGFGLAAIDGIRAIVDLYGGNFESKNNNMDILSYKKGKNKLTIIPFSLDGLPSVPKPYSYKIDKDFEPTEAQLTKLEAELRTSIKSKPENHLFLINIMSELITGMYQDYNKDSPLNSEEVNIALVDWILSDIVSDNLMTPTDLGVLDMMKLHVEMAEGITLANLDYFAGQVWRYCQPTFYKVFSHSLLSDEVMTEIIKIDERIKRYSYGPPVASMKQLILLAEDGTLNLDFVEDPDINLGKKGWMLSKNDKEINATCMINSVIDSPQILKITSPIIKNLLAHDVIKPVHHEFGLEILADGQIVSPDDFASVPIYILGRIAKGSVMGVDAILECFGDRVEKWAEGFICRLEKRPEV